MITIRLLGPGDAATLEHVADDVFDEDVNLAATAEFLADPRHHLAVAIDGGAVVGFASAVHYVHPDKPVELWVNEVGVVPSHQRRGVGLMLVRALLDRGRELGCSQAWVLTDEENTAARGLYAAAGGTETSGVIMVDFDLAAE
ncbi:GNAT family N-acetyltransferase [Chloroflexales bacterium ZM16-3]|nr:GNAT family N-acetyltransferase [Chloroflexales bacterium ZM16-3]